MYHEWSVGTMCEASVLGADTFRLESAQNLPRRLDLAEDGVGAPGSHQYP